jgi:hypothetical protein
VSGSGEDKNQDGSNKSGEVGDIIDFNPDEAIDAIMRPTTPAVKNYPEIVE